MDEFGQNRATLLASIDVALEHVELFAADDDQMGLFLDESFSIKPKYVETEELPLVDLLAFEKETLGIYFSNHPPLPSENSWSRTERASILEAQQAVKGGFLSESCCRRSKRFGRKQVKTWRF